MLNELLYKYRSLINFKDDTQKSNYKFVLNYLKSNEKWKAADNLNTLTNTLAEKKNKLKTTHSSFEKQIIPWHINWLEYKIQQCSIDRDKDSVEFLQGAIKSQMDFLNEINTTIQKF